MTDSTPRGSTEKARALRRNQTPAETILWARLRNRQVGGIKFRRQHPIAPYVVDFASFEHLLVIELDGGHHNEDEARENDAIRTEFIESRGYRVLRFWNSAVEGNLEGVILTIEEAVREPSPYPSPRGRGDETIGCQGNFRPAPYTEQKTANGHESYLFP